MLAMPLPCKILKRYTASSIVDIKTFGSIPKDIQSINPYSVGDVVEFEWGNLSYTDVQTIENTLQTVKTSQRLTYNSQRFLLIEGYSVNISNNRPTITASFMVVQ